MQSQPSNPVRLFIGPLQKITHEAIAFAQQLICNTATCGQVHQCVQCQLIEKKQHWQVTFIAPQSVHYVLADLADMQKMLAFKLSPGEKVCVILEKADYLSPACANSLLKLLEETPEGYTIILLAENLSALLPTIVSRSLVHYYTSDLQALVIPEFARFFFPTEPLMPLEFTKQLDTIEFSHAYVNKILDTVIQYLFKLSINTKNQKQVYGALDIIIKAKANIPVTPASAKIFFRNIYLQIPRL